MRRQFRTWWGFVVLATVTLASSCGHSGASRRDDARIATKLEQAGGMRADPVRERVYVADRTAQRLLVVDPATGGVIQSAALPGVPAGIATDEAGDRLFVALTDRLSVVTLDAVTLAVTRETKLLSQPRNLEWIRVDTVLAATTAGLVEVDVATGSTRSVGPAVAATALLAADVERSLVFAAQPDANGIAIYRFDLSSPIGGNASVVLPQPGPPTGLTLSFDRHRLMVGARQDASLLILNAQTLALIDRVPSASTGPLAMACNRVSTRLYVAPGGPVADGIELERFATFQTLVAPDAIRAMGMVVDPFSAHLLVHLDDDTLRSVPLFNARLQGPLVAVPGADFSVEIRGEPDEGFVLYAGVQPGVTYLDPPGSPAPRFLDLDLAVAMPLASGVLDGLGHRDIVFTVDPAATDGTVLLQSVLLGTPGSGLRAVSNPFAVKVVTGSE